MHKRTDRPPKTMPGKDTKNEHHDPPRGQVSSSEGHIWFYKDVDQESVAELIQQVREAEVEILHHAVRWDTGPSPLHIHIHSYGGELLAGLAAVDAFDRCTVPIHTHIEGGAASAASLISLAGDHRTIGAHSFVLIHQLSSVFWGKYEELKDDMKNSQLFMETIKEFYRERTNLGKKDIKRILKRDLWFPAKKALMVGLVDEIS